MHAIVKYIHHKKQDVVSIVAMDVPDTEDEWFATHLVGLIEGKKPDFNETKKEYLHTTEVRGFLIRTNLSIRSQMCI